MADANPTKMDGSDNDPKPKAPKAAPKKAKSKAKGGTPEGVTVSKQNGFTIYKR